MSVKLAYLPDGWNGAGIYGDFSACGRVVDADGLSALDATDYEGHLHEVPLIPVGLPEPLARIFGQEAPTDDDVSETLTETIEMVESFGWSDEEISVVDASEFMASV